MSDLLIEGNVTHELQLMEVIEENSKKYRVVYVCPNENNSNQWDYKAVLETLFTEDTKILSHVRGELCWATLNGNIPLTPGELIEVLLNQLNHNSSTLKERQRLAE